MTTLIRSGSHLVEAYANWSRWVARCGLCPWADQVRYPQPLIECPLCGTVTEVLWPTEAMVVAVERLLMMRPDPSTRNWSPGESLHDLMQENADHGLMSPERLGVDAPPGTAMFIVDDAGIRLDNLPVLKHRVRRELT